MIANFTENPGRPLASPATHRNEFPTRYSLAGCSPAEPASASLAALILQSSKRPVQENPANGNCPNSWLSQKGAHPTAPCEIFCITTGRDHASRPERISPSKLRPWIDGPPLLPQGAVWKGGVSLVDLAPTILDAAGVMSYWPVLAGISGRGGPSIHGRSLLGEIRSGRDAWSRPVVMQNISQGALHGSYFEERALRTERWKLILRKFDAHPTARDDELYDMRGDPEETKNLYASNGAVVQQLAAMLRKWGEETGDSLAMEMGRRSEEERP